MEAIAAEPIGHVRETRPPQLPEDIQNRIGDQLRMLYDQIAEEPIPDHLLEQLKRLESKE